MSIEVQIENRLKHTKGLAEINRLNIDTLAAIRKGAMRGGAVSDEHMKWMIRTLLEALAFKENVYELWVEDDTKTLDTGYQEDAKKEPQIPIPTSPDVAEATAESQFEIKTEEDVAELQGDTPVGVIKKAAPEPVLEGLDRINQLLN